MASFLHSKTVSSRGRGVSNGGLGGCVSIGPQDEDEAMAWSSWPLRRKKRPSDIDVSFNDQDMSLSTMTPDSIVLHNIAIYESIDSAGVHNMDSNPLEKSLPELPPPTQQGESEGKVEMLFDVRPQTPQTPTQTETLPVELPGSILLPYQGFSQEKLAVIPTRDTLSNRSSEYSRRTSTPSLYNSSTTDEEMDFFKNWTSAEKKSVRANTLPTLPAGQNSKPFMEMSLEELMECLPNLNMSVVSHSWVPAMESELQKIKAMLQEAAERTFESQPNLSSFGSDVNSIAVAARDISRTYFDSMQRVRPLVTRDAEAVQKRLECLQMDLENARAAGEKKASAIADKENLIQRLHETIARNSQTLGSFIQDHIGSCLNNTHDIRAQEVKDVIENQLQLPSGNGSHSPGGYIRIPEKQYMAYLERLRNTQQQVETFSKVAQEQLELIKSQSADLDKRFDECGNCMTALETRNARIQELEARIDQVERELDRAREAAAAHQTLKEEYERLNQHSSSLEWTLQNIKSGCQQKLEDRATEIFTLRQQLGEVVMQAAAHKAETKATVPPQNTAVSTARFRSPLYLARRQEQGQPIIARRARRSGKLPKSQSMLSLNTAEANQSRDSPHPAYRRTPSPISESSRQTGDSASEKEKSGHKLFSGLRMHPPDTATPSLSNKLSFLRLRKESVQTSERRTSTPTSITSTRQLSNSMLVDREKALPTPPPREANISSAISASYAPAVPIHTSTPLLSKTPTTTLTPQKRILSGITERSVEDSTTTNNSSSPNATSTPMGQSPPSASSSDRNAIRGSIAVLDRFEAEGYTWSPVAAEGDYEVEWPIATATEDYWGGEEGGGGGGGGRRRGEVEVGGCSPRCPVRSAAREGRLDVQPLNIRGERKKRLGGIMGSGG